MNHSRSQWKWLRVAYQTSPLAKGKWSKIAVNKQGIFKLTGAQIRSLGFSLPIVSSQFQLFGLDPSLLLEKVPANPVFGLAETALKVNDGGDGQIDEGDNVLFYAERPVNWKHDRQLNRSKHYTRTISDSVFYYISFESFYSS